MFHVIDYTHEDIQQRRNAVRAIDALQYSVWLDDETLAELRIAKAELVDDITAWESLPF